MPNWLDLLGKKKESTDPKEQEQAELELKNVTESIKKVGKIEEDFGKFKTETEKTNTRLTSFLDEQDAMKRRRIAEELAKKANETKETEDKELNELALEDPVKAARLIFERESRGLTTATINTQSQLLRKQLFDDNPDKFEYYDKANPEFKSEVDRLIDGLPLESRTNPDAIQNCYYVAFGRKQQEIKDGKLKSRFAATSTTTSGSSSTKDKDTIQLTELQKKAAKAMGITEEDYGKQAREMNYV